MMKIYTKTGDAGDTGLFDGSRVSKADPRVDAYGEVDELNAWLGLVRARAAADGPAAAQFGDRLERIQRDLFALGALLADPRHKIAARVEKAALDAADIQRLEDWIDELEATLPPLRRFVLAGGTASGASLHVARAVCRRAERRVAALAAASPGAVPSIPLVYLNRLSDLLFVLARSINHRAGVPEIEW